MLKDNLLFKSPLQIEFPHGAGPKLVTNPEIDSLKKVLFDITGKRDQAIKLLEHQPGVVGGIASKFIKGGKGYQWISRGGIKSAPLRALAGLLGVGAGVGVAGMGVSSINKNLVQPLMQKNSCDNSKQAGAAQLMGSLFRGAIDKGVKGLDNTASFLRNNPKTEEAFRKFTSNNLVDPNNRWRNTAITAIGGGGIGALTGATSAPSILNSDDSTMDKIKGIVGNVLSGAAKGGLGGAILGRYGPQAMQKGLGRVMTNVVDPYGYDISAHANAIAKDGPMNLLKAIVKDEPMAHLKEENGLFNSGIRHQLNREAWGLKPRGESLGGLIQTGVRENGSGIYEFNPGDSRGAMNLDDVKKNMLDSVKKYNMSIPYGEGNEFKTPTNYVMGGYEQRPSGEFRDVWDIGLNPGERIDSKERIGRSILSMFQNPAEIRGKTISQADALSQFSETPQRLHPSFLRDPSTGQDIHSLIGNAIGVPISDVHKAIANAAPGVQHDIRRQIVGMNMGFPFNANRAADALTS